MLQRIQWPWLVIVTISIFVFLFLGMYFVVAWRWQLFEQGSDSSEHMDPQLTQHQPTVTPNNVSALSNNTSIALWSTTTFFPSLSTMDRLPSCFANQSAMRIPEALHGTWRFNGTLVKHPRWDLSTCPFEHPFESCNQKTKRATAKEFKPLNCSLGLTAEGRLPRVLYLIGDSLMRQVFISLACQFWLNLNETEKQALPIRYAMCGPEYDSARWPFDRARKRRYPTTSFNIFCFCSVAFPAIELVVINLHAQHPLPFALAKLPVNGTFVMLAGVHGPDLSAIKWGIQLASSLKKRRLGNKVIWTITPPQHFVGPSGNGFYLTRNLTRTAQSGCAVNVTKYRQEMEMHLLQKHIPKGIIDGLVGLSGMGGLGDAKGSRNRVRQFAGTTLDCTHFCSPGPAYDIGNAILTSASML